MSDGVFGVEKAKVFHRKTLTESFRVADGAKLRLVDHPKFEKQTFLSRRNMFNSPASINFSKWVERLQKSHFPHTGQHSFFFKSIPPHSFFRKGADIPASAQGGERSNKMKKPCSHLYCIISQDWDILNGRQKKNPGISPRAYFNRFEKLFLFPSAYF